MSGIALTTTPVSLTLTDTSSGLVVALGANGSRLLLSLVPVLGDGRPTSVELQVPSADNIASGRVVRSRADGAALLATPDTPATTWPILGVTRNAAGEGGMLYVVRSGALENPGWAWTPGAPLWLGAGGEPTQTEPASGMLVEIGFALTATTIVVDLQRPLPLP